MYNLLHSLTLRFVHKVPGWWNGIHARLKIVWRKPYGFKSHSRHFVKENKKKIVVIVGPTASGKTSLSIELAKKYNGEIISADSRQVYKGLDLGTGKVTEAEMQGVPHHMLDVADPRTIYTVADYVRDADAAIEDIGSRGKLPIVVGGTFLYVDTLLGKITTPDVPPNEALRKELDTLPTEALATRLETLDKDRFDDIDTHNRPRLIRAIEIATALGKVPKIEPSKRYDALVLGIDIDKETLAANIHKRLRDRFDIGMVEEVKGLQLQGLSFERMEDLGLEYRYIARHLQGQMRFEDMVEELETKIRQYAKRQMTWLKRDKEIVWVRKEDTQGIEETIKNF